MIESRLTLAPHDLDAIAELERRVVAVDGGRLKLEWGLLRTRPGGRPADFVCTQDGHLVGFVGIYSFGEPPELAGMVDPAVRRRGIGRALLDAALAECGQRGLAEVMLVVPRPSAAGAALARSRGGSLHHSEHAMVLRGAPAAGPRDASITVRGATAADSAVVRRLLAAGFGWAPPDAGERLSSDRATTQVVLRDGVPVGTLRLTTDGATGSVYGFVIDPAVQGQGIGRDVLRRACVQLRAGGASQVTLEVAVDNERALGLYTSIGFEPVITEDYYRLAP